MTTLEIFLRALMFVLLLYAIWGAWKLLCFIPKILNPRSLGRASAVVEQKARDAVSSFKDGRGSGP